MEERDKLSRLLAGLDADNAELLETLATIRAAERKALTLRALADMASELEADGINAVTIRRKMAELTSDPAHPAPDAKALPSTPSSNGHLLPLLPAPRKRGRPPKNSNLQPAD